MAKKSQKVMPITIPGKWSVGACIAMPILFFIGKSLTNTMYQSVPAGETILADIATRPILALTMLTGMGAGILALITGLLAIFKQKEKAVLVYISSSIGALFTLFLAAEILFPH